MTNEEAIKLIDDRMCWGRGRWSKHHMPEIDEYWQAGVMAIDALKAESSLKGLMIKYGFKAPDMTVTEFVEDILPSAQPEIIRCKDCKFYTPMNRETKTGICRLLMHQNFGDDWYCAGAERRTDGNGRN